MNATTCRKEAASGRKPKQRYPKPQPETKAKIAYLRPFISPYHTGHETPLGCRPLHTKLQINQNLKRGFNTAISQERLRQHHEEVKPHFFTVNLNHHEIFAPIDIDAGGRHGVGTKEGAEAFANHLIGETFAEFAGVLYDELSTHFIGRHLYAVIPNPGRRLTRDRVVELFRKLQEICRAEMRRTKPDIADVETKGHPARLADNQRCWPPPPRQVEGYGQLMKIPLLAQPGDLLRLQNTIRLAPEDIDRLHLEIVGSTERQPARKSRGAKSDDKSKADTEPKKRRQTSGSCCMVPEADLAKRPAFEAWATAKGIDNLKTYSKSYGARVYAADVADGIIVVQAIQRTMPDDTMPFRQARIEGLWQKLYHEGVLDRPFNPHRWKVIRTELSRHGYIRVIDSRYWFTIDGEPGQGRAMIWRLNVSRIEAEAIRPPAEDKAAREDRTITDTPPVHTYPRDPLMGQYIPLQPRRILYWRHGPSPDAKLDAPHHLSA